MSTVVRASVHSLVQLRKHKRNGTLTALTVCMYTIQKEYEQTWTPVVKNLSFRKMETCRLNINHIWMK